jgi:hypothetical protein
MIRGGGNAMTRRDLSIQTDVLSLSRKLAEFDKSLTPAERMLFRARILTDLSGDEDVEGHRMERRWTPTEDGAYFEWVFVDESGGSSGRGGIDPQIWDSLRRSGSSLSDAATAMRLEGTT